MMDEKWLQYLKEEVQKDYIKTISNRVNQERKNFTVYPEPEDVLNVLNDSFDNIKVVILGQDCYHNGVAHGYAFSSKNPNYIPVSLRNIFKEISTDLGILPEKNSNLARWANQGVFLLNTILTVRAGSALSHENVGWQKFTNEIIKILDRQRKHLVFLLWGAKAREYTKFINSDKHLILQASHPASEVYGNGDFFGCKHFSKCNEFLKKHKLEKINWR